MVYNIADNPLLKEPLESPSEDEVETMEVSGVLTQGKVSEVGVKKATHINNVAKLKERLIAIQKNLDWIEHLDVTVDLKMTAEDKKVVIGDSFKQEHMFYKQAHTAASQALPRLRSLGVETLRPQDYFAEMVKSDQHMRKIKEKLISKQLVAERTEKVTKMRKMKKLGKKVQQEVLKKRADDKKSMLSDVKKMRKGKAAADALNDDQDDFNVSVADDKGSKKDGGNKKRMGKNAKYGSGGMKRGSKKNTEDSYKDVSSFSSRIHSKPKRSAKNDKIMGKMAGKGGKPGGKPGGKNARPGKTKRQNMKGRQKK